MADIAFLLIIYFMVCSTLAASRGLDFKQPPENPLSVEIDPLESVLVEVLAGGKLIVDSKPMELASILGYLEPKLARNPAKPVILRSHPDAPYGRMVEVFDLLRQGDSERQIESVHDLTFGEYIRLLENKDSWERLGISLDRVVFIKRLKEVKDIRNNVMHFDPDGTPEQELATLRDFSDFLHRLREIVPTQTA
jgi:biopolymer transport protein ExbD